MGLKEYIINKTIAIVLGISTIMQTGAEEATIRVLLMTSDYGGYFHETIDVHELEDGQNQIMSIQRNNGNPIYPGELEIKETKQGYLIINKVSIEEYLKRVVPSEMPAGYEEEALKAQAVCARTYAYRQIRDKALEEYGADVDDSVSFQVYNNQELSERTNQAVENTTGEIMTYEGEPITAYFFSTSSGSTSTDEVWKDESAPCLKSIVTEYDADMPWYRWHVQFSCEQLEYLLEEAGYNIGKIKEVKVTKRSQGGAAIACEFKGSIQTICIENELKIRQLLSPMGLKIVRQDDSVVSDFKILPSAYFTCSPVYEGDRLTGFIFDGGGYGHGVGMSQNGANGMAKAGYNYKEILNHYYDGFQLEHGIK